MSNSAKVSTTTIIGRVFESDTDTNLLEIRVNRVQPLGGSVTWFYSVEGWNSFSGSRTEQERALTREEADSLLEGLRHKRVIDRYRAVITL